MAAGAPAPAVRAERAMRSAGKRSSSGAVNVSCPIAARSSLGAGQSIRSGQAQAQAIGERMSGGPSCASVEPSVYSTMLCTTDCGCTSTSMRVAGMPKRYEASIISRPLFIIVAESTEILAPMLQLGWATACSGVAAAMASIVA